MKNTTFTLLFLIILGTISSCKEKIAPSGAIVNGNYTENLRTAKKWINGKWNLVAVVASVPNPHVPNVQLIVNNRQITVIEDGKQIDKVNYEIIQTLYAFQLKTTAKPRSDNWYVRNPALQISENKMFLDLGSASDFPAFTFERIK